MAGLGVRVVRRSRGSAARAASALAGVAARLLTVLAPTAWPPHGAALFRPVADDGTGGTRASASAGPDAS